MPDRGKKITEMYAFVCTEEDGTEGIPAVSDRGMMLPMTGADMKRVESLIPMAQGIANLTGRPMKIVRFHQMEKIGGVNPL